MCLNQFDVNSLSRNFPGTGRSSDKLSQFARQFDTSWSSTRNQKKQLAFGRRGGIIMGVSKFLFKMLTK